MALFQPKFEMYNEQQHGNQLVLYCESKVTMNLGDVKQINNGQCMMTKKLMILRNTPNNNDATKRIILCIKDIKSLQKKSSTFSTAKLIINLSTTWSKPMQLAFKNGSNSRNKFQQKLQSLMKHSNNDSEGNQTTTNQDNNEDDLKSNPDGYESLSSIISKENVIDDICKNYKTVSSFMSRIKSIYKPDIANVISKITEFDSGQYNFRLNNQDKKLIRNQVFNCKPNGDRYRGMKFDDYKEAVYPNPYPKMLNNLTVLHPLLCKLFAPYLPMKVSNDIQRAWLENLLKATKMYNITDKKQNKLCCDAMDLWITTVWGQAYDGYGRTFFRIYDNLFVVRHLVKNHSLRGQHIIPISEFYSSFLRNRNIPGLDSCFIDLLDFIRDFERIENVHCALLEFMTKYEYKINSYLIKQLIIYLQRHLPSDRSIYPKCLYLQNYITGVIDEDESLIAIKVNLLIDKHLLNYTDKREYNGLTPLSMAKQKSVKPTKIIKYLSNIIDKLEGDNAPFNTNDNDDNKEGMGPAIVSNIKSTKGRNWTDDDDEDTLNESELSDQDLLHQLNQARADYRKKDREKMLDEERRNLEIARLQLMSEREEQRLRREREAQEEEESAINRRVRLREATRRNQSDLEQAHLERKRKIEMMRTQNNLTLPNLGQRLDNLEKINRELLETQNLLMQEIDDLKKNESKDNEYEGDEDELFGVQQILIDHKEWHLWTYLEIVKWIIDLENGRYKKYKKTLIKSMKEENVKGNYLSKIEKIDLKNFFGIKDFGDICDLHDEIQSLVD